MNSDDIFTVEFTSELGHGNQENTPEMEPGMLMTPHAPTPTWQGGSGTTTATRAGVQFVSPPPDLNEEELVADHDEDASLHFWAVDDVVGPGLPPTYVVRDLGHGRLLMVSAKELASLAQAQQEACWHRAMEEELRSIEKNRTWTLTELPRGQHAIGLKWVFKVKKDEHGAILRHKAQLVMKGYTQREGIDYTEVFALVARHMKDGKSTTWTSRRRS
jgi:hypothetical protein